MEYVPGQDLEQQFRTLGPIDPAEACDLVAQVGAALVEVHKHNLVHLEVDPSNILVTAKGQAKLLDFASVRQLTSRTSDLGATLEMFEYIAPEQARDASSVDIRADIYGLGGTLFWCLTGRPPFSRSTDVAKDLARRSTQPPLSVSVFRQDIAPQFDAVVARMMAVNPDDRYPTSEAVVEALLPFSQAATSSASGTLLVENHPVVPCDGKEAPEAHPILIVGEDPEIRKLCRSTVETEGLRCQEAANGMLALEASCTSAPDLVLLDTDLSGMTGVEMLHALRQNHACQHLKIIMLCTRVDSEAIRCL